MGKILVRGKVKNHSETKIAYYKIFHRILKYIETYKIIFKQFQLSIQKTLVFFSKQPS